MLKRSPALLLIFLSVLSNLSAQTELEPFADSFLDSNQPNSNQGNQAVLSLANGKRPVIPSLGTTNETAVASIDIGGLITPINVTHEIFEQFESVEFQRWWSRGVRLSR